MTTVAIHQPQYLPYLGFFHKLAHCDTFILLDHAQFQKNGVQNRNKIKASDGWHWLTVPVLQHLGQAINKVAINPNVTWARKHWNALVTSYGGAPFFDSVGASLKTLLLEREYRDLFSLDLAMMRWVMNALEIDKPILLSSELNVEGKQSELLVNLCQAANADCYLSGPGGKRYMDVDQFANAGIRIEFQEFNSPVYPQVFAEKGFCPDLSVVDVLFCCGPSARVFIE